MAQKIRALKPGAQNKIPMAKTKEQVLETLLSTYEDLCLLDGQGVDKPAPRALAGLIATLAPRDGRLAVNQIRIKLRSQPKPVKTDAVQPAAPAELGKPQGAQPVRQPQPPKVEPEQAPLSALKSEGVVEGENVVAAEPLTADEIESMLSMKPIEAEENYSAERVRATLVSLGTDANGLEIKTYRQLFNITRNYFA